MKRLTLVRHATAQKRRADHDDRQRALKKKGKREAENMARRVRKLYGVPDVLLSSPAVRARETAEIFATTMGIPHENIAYHDALYGGLDAQGFLQFVHVLNDADNWVMIFGHDPLLSDFAQYLSSDFTESIPKCGVLHFSTRRQVWHTLRAGDVQVEAYEYPLTLPPTKKLKTTLQADIHAEIAQKLQQLAETFNGSQGKKLQKSLDASVAELSKLFVKHAHPDYFEYYMNKQFNVPVLES